ncbi:MAG TPA: phytanoyl-CoA dioxygenase family protein [Capsulimonadaceae bacterium]|nr:phytanoyl-CoA dioxygenase family protein [Capsulimonadaceae bacterium]
MVFSESEITQFQEQGFVAKPSFFNLRETAAIQAEIQRLKAEGRLRNVTTEGDGKTRSQVKQNLQLCPMSPHSRLFRALPFHAKVVDAIAALIGDPVILHLDQVFLKPEKHGSGTNWHQDNAYFQIADPMQGTAMWIAVHDATVANGTLHVIPRSHRERYEHSRDPESDHHIRCYPREADAMPVELPSGGVVFFSYGTAHCTRANTTENERAGAAFHFLNGNAISPCYFKRENGGMKHPLLTGAQASGGSEEYDVVVAGTWEEEIARALS